MFYILYQTIGEGEAAKFSNVALWAKLHKTQFYKKIRSQYLIIKLEKILLLVLMSYFLPDKVYCIAYIGYNWFDNSVSVSNTIQKYSRHHASNIKFVCLLYQPKARIYQIRRVLYCFENDWLLTSNNEVKSKKRIYDCFGRN